MRKGIVHSLLLYLGFTSALWAQAFQNLDFEDANLSPVPDGQLGGPVSITNAFPDWTGYIGMNQVALVLQNNATLGEASIDIYGPHFPASAVLQGQYSAVLGAGGNPFGSGSANASLVQFGLVPTDAKSVFLEIAGTNFSMSFSGQTIPLSAIGSGSNYTLYGGDISAFAGLVEELSVSTVDPTGPGFIFDDIQFSPDAIPEPSSLNLLVIGALGLALWHRTRRRTA